MGHNHQLSPLRSCSCRHCFIPRSFRYRTRTRLPPLADKIHLAMHDPSHAQQRYRCAGNRPHHARNHQIKPKQHVGVNLYPTPTCCFGFFYAYFLRLSSTRALAVLDSPPLARGKLSAGTSSTLGEFPVIALTDSAISRLN